MWKKARWKRTNLSKHHRLNLAKCFFSLSLSPLFIRNKFFEYFDSMWKQQKSKNFGFFTLNWNSFRTNNRYNTKILTKSIEFSIKRRINKLIFNFAFLLTICFVPFNTRGNGRASNLLELKLQKTLNPKIKIQNPDYHIFIPIFTPNPNHPN